MISPQFYLFLITCYYTLVLAVASFTIENKILFEYLVSLLLITYAFCFITLAYINLLFIGIMH